MGFSDAVTEGFSNYVNFQGRARRSAFWWWVLFSLLCSAGAATADAAMLGAEAAERGGPVGALIGIALFLPGLALQVRRLHDTGHSGWWVLIALTGIGLILLLVWYCTDSSPGTNAFGRNPKVLSNPGAFAASRQASDADLARLEQLGRLRREGVLTEQEFQLQKAKLLGA